MMALARGCLTAALIFTAGIVQAQLAQVGQDATAQAERASQNGDYLSAAALWRQLALTDTGEVRDGGAWQRWAEAEALLTGEPPLRTEIVSAPPESSADRATIARIKRARARNAIAEIVARARRTRIVILNEHHLVPRSRAFALEVERALRPLGYDVLAAEAFGNDPDPARYVPSMAGLVRDGYVRDRTGYYTHDPVFAAFVREALAIGYRPVAYESTDYVATDSQDEQISRREQGQADYLMQRALAAFPNSKILIYVGHGHVRETPVMKAGDKLPLTMMAARLKAATGIDPLTIDQTVFLQPEKDTNRIAAAFLGRAEQGSVVLVDSAGPIVVGRFSGSVDLQVAHPHLPRVADRPGWLAALGRKAVKVPTAMLPTVGRRLIQAFPAGAAEDAVPIDQVVIEAGRSPPALMLDHRPYILRYRDEARTFRP